MGITYLSHSHSSSSARIWLDPTCPWAWQTAQWLEEVGRLRESSIDWRVMSLALLPGNQARVKAGDPALRSSLLLTALLVGVQEEYGMEAQHRLYLELGERIHHRASVVSGNIDQLIIDSVTAAALPPEAAELAATDSYRPQLQASTDEALTLVGDQVGTPIIAVGEVAFFGPVISRVPRGEAAVRMFEGVLAVAAFDGFFELKRSRNEKPQFG